MDPKSTALQNRLKLKRRFCNIVHDFSDAKQLSMVQMKLRWHFGNIL